MSLKPINECTTVAELLADKSRFAQWRKARNGYGRPCDVSDPEVVCFCLVGAIEKVTGKSYLDTAQYEKLRSIVGEVADFNDSHTYEEVYKLVLEAGI
jgi:hypothetical protein